MTGTSRMLRGAPPAVGPTGTTGRVRAAEATHRRMHISAPLAARSFGDRAASGPKELRDSERTYASTHAYLGTAGRGTRKVGCERAGGAA